MIYDLAGHLGAAPSRLSLETLLHGWCDAFLEIVDHKSEIENEMVPVVAVGSTPVAKKHSAVKPEAKLKGPKAFSHSRPKPWRSQHWVKAPPSNKEQTPLGDLCDPKPRFHGGCFGV